MNCSIVVNPVTLLVIALSQRLKSTQPHSKGSNNLCGILLNLKGSRYIYIGNHASVVVLEIDTSKLDLQGGRTVYLHDILYALEVRQNLVYVLALLQLGFYIVFVGCCVKIYLEYFL